MRGDERGGESENEEDGASVGAGEVGSLMLSLLALSASLMVPPE